MSMIDRVLEIQQKESKSVRAFELSIGKTSGYLNMLKKRNGTPGGDVLEKILNQYPSYNPLWLITGKGDKKINNKALVLESSNYGKLIDGEAGEFLKVFEEFVISLIKKQTDQKFKKLNSDILILLKKSMREDKGKKANNNNALSS